MNKKLRGKSKRRPTVKDLRAAWRVFRGDEQGTPISRNERYSQLFTLFALNAGHAYKEQAFVLMKLLLKFRCQSSISIDEFMDEIDEYLQQNQEKVERESGTTFKNRLALHEGFNKMKEALDDYFKNGAGLTVVDGRTP